MPDSLLSTKLFIPAARPELVPRPALIKQLSDGLHRKLTLVSAPAGFGKTTQAAEWIDHLQSGRQEQPRIAWLSLDETDNDIRRFLTYFFTAINQLGVFEPGTGNTSLEMLQVPNSTPIDMILTPIISELAAVSEKIIIVLDDYHLIESKPIHNALDFWLDNAPHQVHTVILTREDPPFRLARLRAQNQMTELRAADLRFSEAEAAQFLNEIMGLQLDAAAVRLLEERTEGWVAGLQMAALSMRDRKDVVGFIENFSGTNRFILDYLLEEVLANQAPEIQQFLLQTSMLRHLSAPLCDALLEQEGRSAAVLTYLEQSNLFLLPMDDQRIWYRYHHLFADLLRARLQQTISKAELAALHARAARWHEDNNQAYGAIYHASLIPDDEWVERVIDQNYMEIFQRRESASIRHWTGELNKAMISTRPRLAIHEANSLAWFGQLEDADQLLNAAETRLKKEEPTPETLAMFGYLDYVRSRVTAMCGDFEQAIALGISARENTSTDNQGLLGGIGVMLGYGYFLNGDFANAAITLQETIDSGKVYGAVNTTVGAYCVLARLHAIQGQLQRSSELYREAEYFVDRSEGRLRGAMSIVDLGFAEIMYEKNELEAAKAHIQEALEFIPLWSKADDIAMAQIIFSQIQRAGGDPAAAEKNIEKATQIINTSGIFSESRDVVIAADVLFRLEQQDHYAVSRWVSALEKRLGEENAFRFENELVLIALAKVYLAQQKFDQGITLLSQLEEAAETTGRAGRLIKVLILQALILEQIGELERSYSVLERALTLAGPEGYVRIFVDEGEPMQKLLSKWTAEAGDSPVIEYARYLGTQFDQGTGEAESGSNDLLIEPLSPREIEVLTLIAQGKTNKEISTKLFVSPGTVKAHTSSIYRKLDVANRTEAVARARELEILS